MRQIQKSIAWSTWSVAVLGLVSASVCSKRAFASEESSPTGVFAITTNEEMDAYDRAHAATATVEREATPIPNLEGQRAPHGVDISRLKPWLVPSLPSGPPLEAKDTPQPAPGGDIEAPPTQASFIGVVDNNTSIPPDTMGAVGTNHLFSFLNTGRAIYNKAGGLVSAQISLVSFWSALGTGVGQPAQSPFDPRVEFDQYTNRWVVASVGFANGTNTAWVLVGISQTDNPTGAWNLFSIPVHVAPHTTANWLDFPGLGLDYNNVIITGNLATTAGALVHADVYVISKASLIAAAGPLVLGTDYSLHHNPCSSVVGTNFSFQPCHTYGQNAGNSVNYLCDQGWYDTGVLTSRYLRFTIVNGTGAAATLDCLGDQGFVLVNGYNFNRLDATQPAGCSAINTNDTRMRDRGVVRNGKIFFTHHVGNGAPPATPSPPATRCEVRWYEVDPAQIVAPGLPNQQGAVGHASLAYYYSSMAVNEDECIMIGFSGSDAATFVSAYYTARRATDPAGTMQPVNLLKAGEDTYFKRFGGTRNRWGDYSATSVDPVDDESMWTIQEYARPESGAGCPTADTGRWATWWGRMLCKPPCGTCRGDVNNDNKEDGADISQFAACYLGINGFAAGCGCADIDGDGDVDDADLALLVASLMDIGIGDPSELCP